MILRIYIIATTHGCIFINVAKHSKGLIYSTSVQYSRYIGCPSTTNSSTRARVLPLNQVAYVETLSVMTKVQLAVTQVNMAKTLECECLRSQRHTGCWNAGNTVFREFSKGTRGSSDTVSAV